MSYTVKEAKVGNETVRIVQDSYVESPRSWDNLAKMIFTGGYTHLGDNHEVNFGNEFFESRQDFIYRGEQIVRRQIKDVVVCYPVHLYEHSGTSISISDSYPYNCRWDSGTIGFAIVTKEDIRKNWNIKRVTKEYIEQADRILKGEVETLNQYVMGEVYGFIVEDENGEHIDSCYGFYGSDIEENGIADYLEKKYLEVLVD